MDPKSQERLAAIIAQGPDSITEPDAGFLRARRSYLTEEQRALFRDALKTEAPSAPEETAAEAEAETAKPAKKK